MKRQELSNADIVRIQEKVIDDYFWKYYENNDVPFGLCSLCGNSGVIDTRGTAVSGAGVDAGRLNYCICMNGRAMREENAPLRDLPARQQRMIEHLDSGGMAGADDYLSMGE